jgi:hypothetical protein
MLSLWPGEGQVHEGASAYACLFLQEAKNAGFGTPSMLPKLEIALIATLKNKSGAN